MAPLDIFCVLDSMIIMIIMIIISVSSIIDIFYPTLPTIISKFYSGMANKKEKRKNQTLRKRGRNFKIFIF